MCPAKKADAQLPGSILQNVQMEKIPPVPDGIIQ